MACGFFCGSSVPVSFTTEPCHWCDVAWICQKGLLSYHSLVIFPLEVTYSLFFPHCLKNALWVCKEPPKWITMRSKEIKWACYHDGYWKFMRPALCQQNKLSCLLPICKKNALYKNNNNKNPTTKQNKKTPNKTPPRNQTPNPRNLTLFKWKGVGTSQLEQLLDSSCFSLPFFLDSITELFLIWVIFLRKSVKQSSRIHLLI